MFFLGKKVIKVVREAPVVAESVIRQRPTILRTVTIG
jgi:hypothetical protein